MKPVFLIALLAAVSMSAGCQSRPQTVFPETRGTAFNLMTDEPLSGVSLSVVDGKQVSSSDETGAFSLAAKTKPDRSLPLPASGVYRSTAVIKAEAGSLYAFAPVDFVNPFSKAESAVAVFLIERNAPYETDALPSGCTPPPQAVYALQLLGSGQSSIVQKRLDRTDGYRFTLEQWLDRVLVRQLPTRCDIPRPALMRWMDEIRAFVGGED